MCYLWSVASSLQSSKHSWTWSMQAGFNYPVRLLIGREPTGSRIKDKKVSLINSVSKIKKITALRLNVVIKTKYYGLTNFITLWLIEQERVNLECLYILSFISRSYILCYCFGGFTVTALLNRTAILSHFALVANWVSCNFLKSQTTFLEIFCTTSCSLQHINAPPCIIA